MSEQVFRWKEWTRPVTPVSREVLTSQPADEIDLTRPPLLFVPGYAHGAWVFAEKWLEHAAGRGYQAYAMSLRGHGDSGSAPGTTLRAYAHDVVQVAARLPRQAVLIGHGVGALAVAQALSRYPARAGVLLAPVIGGPRTLAAALRHNPIGTVPGLFGAPLRLGRPAVRRPHGRPRRAAGGLPARPAAPAAASGRRGAGARGRLAGRSGGAPRLARAHRPALRRGAAALPRHGA
jgi:pimeloyl-ACP methyl ester carboxylesterase